MFATVGSPPCGRYLLAPLTRFSTNILYNPLDNTRLCFMLSVERPWGWRLLLLRRTPRALESGPIKRQHFLGVRVGVKNYERYVVVVSPPLFAASPCEGGGAVMGMGYLPIVPSMRLFGN